MLMGSRVKGKEFAKFIKGIIDQAKGFEKLMLKLNIVDGGDGKCTAVIKLEQEHINLHGNVHGGVVATLLDVVTTYALMTKPCNPGVSVDMQVMFMKGPKEGEELIIDANTVHVANNVAYIECELRQKSTGEIIAKGAQSKFVDFDVE